LFILIFQQVRNFDYGSEVYMLDSSEVHYSTTEAANVCQFSTQIINRLCDDGTLKHYRIPGGSRERRIPQRWLLRLIRKHGVVPSPDLSTVGHALVVTGNPDLVESMREELHEHERPFLFAADNYYDAGAIAYAQNVDLFVADLQMGVEAAQHVCCSMRRLPDFEHVPIIAISDSPHTKVQCNSVSKTFCLPNDWEDFAKEFVQLMRIRRHPI